MAPLTVFMHLRRDMKQKTTPKTTILNPAKKSKLNTITPQERNVTPFSPTADQVAARAYLKYENHGAANGRDLNDWLGAEAELITEHQLTVTL